MNYHNDSWIKARLQEHYEEAKTIINEENIVGIFIQGSQNYGLDVKGSDIDTKLIVVPTLDDLIFNKEPISTTHIRENEEHIDIKDIRVYFTTFVKQNLNFLEILFTPYYIINPMYEDAWNKLIERRELIARMNPVRAVKSMAGIAGNRYVAMQHPYPSKLGVLDKFGYDPKQLHHLLRVDEYLERYINGESYESCLIPHDSEYLKKVKEGMYNVDEAMELAEKTFGHTLMLEKDYCNGKEIIVDENAQKLLDSVQIDIMRKCLVNNLKNERY